MSMDPSETLHNSGSETALDTDVDAEPPSGQGLLEYEHDPASALGLHSCMELPQIILPDKELPAHFLFGNTHPLLPNLCNLYDTEVLAP